mgnify:CR=1 FL=1
MTHRRRIVSLLGSLLVALSAGSTYVFSSYAPQLQSALHLSSTQLNVLGLSSNLGMYMSGPFWGQWIDKKGPHGAILCGAVAVLLGYGMLSRAYKYEWQTLPVSILAFFLLLTGVGNSAANNSAINVQAKSWSRNKRGSAMAAVLATFGLSAFVYSTVSHAVFHGDVAGYLTALALGSFFCFMVGFFMIKIVPPDLASEDQENLLHDSHTEVADERSEQGHHADDAQDEGEQNRRDPNAEETSDHALEAVSGHAHDVTGWSLLYEPDFFLLFIILGLISGAGLLLINNVGTITQVLWTFNHQKHPKIQDALTSSWLNQVSGLAALIKKEKKSEKIVQRIQALQVSSISLGNASGRIGIGVLSDVLVHITHDSSSRTYLLLVVAFLALASQVLAATPGVICNVDRLLIISGLTGLMYGTLFGLCPNLVFEWFGMRSFSQNWGWIGFAPVIGGNAYNLLFGLYVDVA